MPRSSAQAGRTWGKTVLLLAVVSLVTACGKGGIIPATASGSAAVRKVVPDFAGKGLLTAEDDAQAAGFGNLASHDASGRGRMQILDPDWKVCFQAPAAGTVASTGGKLNFGVVKLGEACPAMDEGAHSPVPVSEGQPMPDLAGRSLNVAIASLPSSTSIVARDVSGRHRLIIVQSDWKICSQRPKPGATFRGQPVYFKVVKFGESCP